jgi:tetratricopeptide (TPR) repeat protein
LAGLADALDRLGRRGEALDHLDQAAKIAPFRTSHRVARTRMLIEAGREEEALADLDVLISRPAGCGAARLMRARIRAARGDLDGAAEDYQAMIDGDCDTEEEFQAAWAGMEELGLIPET